MQPRHAAMIDAQTRREVICAVAQTSAALINPIPKTCSWNYDHLSATIQSNFINCFPPVVNQLDTFKAYEKLLTDKVYPYLVRNWPACDIDSATWMHTRSSELCPR